MRNLAKIFCLTALLASCSIGLALASDSELASVDTQCFGASCAMASQAINTPGDDGPPFSPSPWRLVIAGAVLLAVSLVGLKISKPK